MNIEKELFINERQPLYGCTGKPLDIDRKLTDAEELVEELAEMVALLQEMSIEKIRRVHARALKEIPPEDEIKEYLNDMIASIIAGKAKEGVTHD